MTEVRYVKLEDQEFWYRLDKHLPKQEFERKVREKRGYVLLSDENPVGLLIDIPEHAQPMELFMIKSI